MFSTFFFLTPIAQCTRPYQTIDAFTCAVNATTGAPTATITGRLTLGSLARTVAYRLAFTEAAAARVDDAQGGSNGNGNGNGNGKSNGNGNGNVGGGGTVHFELDIENGDTQPALNQVCARMAGQSKHQQ